jgi:hypothetical protein
VKKRTQHTTRIGALTACLAATVPSFADPAESVSPSAATIPAPATSTGAAAAAPGPATPSVTRQTVALASAGVALAGVATAVTFGVLALQNKRDFDSNPTFASSDKGNDDAAYADGGIALAVCAGVTSLVLWLTHGASAGDPVTSTPTAHSAGLSASPIVTAHGAGAGAILRF